jgi:peptidoglycan/LPS O-acetylase OafA/YrhL
MNGLANLDILRALAVLLVAVSHVLMYTGHDRLTSWMGLTGVCMFFVHTCLVLMFSLERDPHPGRFYIRRLFRLFPLWLVVLGLSVVLRIPASPRAAPGFAFHQPSVGELLANIFMTFNFQYGANVVGASWSLPIEAQMYLFLPPLFFFVRSERILWVLVALDAFIIFYVWSITPAGVASTLPTCIPFFLPGVMAYVVTRKTKPFLASNLFPLYLAAGVAAHLALGFLYHHFGIRHTPLLVRFDPLFNSAFFCLALGLTLPLFRQVQFAPVVRAAHLIARYSYGIYLCHIPAIVVTRYYLHDAPIALRLAGFFATIVLAPILLYHAIEEPMIRLGSRVARKVESGPEPRMNESNLSLEPAP